MIMSKLDAYEQEILDAYEAGKLKLSPVKKTRAGKIQSCCASNWCKK